MPDRSPILHLIAPSQDPSATLFRTYCYLLHVSTKYRLMATSPSLGARFSVSCMDNRSLMAPGEYETLKSTTVHSSRTGRQTYKTSITNRTVWPDYLEDALLQGLCSLRGLEIQYSRYSSSLIQLSSDLHQDSAKAAAPLSKSEQVYIAIHLFRDGSEEISEASWEPPSTAAGNVHRPNE